MNITGRTNLLNELAGGFRLPSDRQLWSATLKLKRNLALVCRTFRRLSQRFLYETIIYDGAQGILKKLRTNDCGRFVKSILFRPIGSRITSEDISELYQICRNLEEVSVYPLALAGQPSPHPSQIFGPLPHTVFAIAWIQHFLTPMNFFIPATLGHLRMLTIMSTYNVFADASMCLPHVETVHVRSSCRFPDSRWSLPSLKYLRIVYTRTDSFDRSLVNPRLQHFVKSHAQQLLTLCLDVPNPLPLITQEDLCTDMLLECNNVKVLLVSHVLALFLPRIVPQWTLPSLRCVVIMLNESYLVDLTDFMRIWNGFHAHDKFSHIEHFVVLHHHSMLASVDLEHIYDMCGYDGRLSFQCRSDFVANY